MSAVPTRPLARSRATKRMRAVPGGAATCMGSAEDGDGDRRERGFGVGAQRGEASGEQLAARREAGGQQDDIGVAAAVGQVVPGEVARRGVEGEVAAAAALGGEVKVGVGDGADGGAVQVVCELLGRLLRGENGLLLLREVAVAGLHGEARPGDRDANLAVGLRIVGGVGGAVGEGVVGAALIDAAADLRVDIVARAVAVAAGRHREGKKFENAVAVVEGGHIRVGLRLVNKRLGPALRQRGVEQVGLRCAERRPDDAERDPRLHQQVAEIAQLRVDRIGGADAHIADGDRREPAAGPEQVLAAGNAARGLRKLIDCGQYRAHVLLRRCAGAVRVHPPDDVAGVLLEDGEQGVAVLGVVAQQMEVLVVDGQQRGGLRHNGGLSLQPLDQPGARVGAVGESRVQFVENNQRDRSLADLAEVCGGVDEQRTRGVCGHGVGRGWLEAGDRLRDCALGDAELVRAQVGDGLAIRIGDGDIEQHDLALHLKGCGLEGAADGAGGAEDCAGARDAATPRMRQTVRVRPMCFMLPRPAAIVEAE